jgi:hypothetical protein
MCPVEEEEEGLCLRHLHLRCKHVLQAGVRREGIVAQRALTSGVVVKQQLWRLGFSFGVGCLCHCLSSSAPELSRPRDLASVRGQLRL